MHLYEEYGEEQEDEMSFDRDSHVHYEPDPEFDGNDGYGEEEVVEYYEEYDDEYGEEVHDL